MHSRPLRVSTTALLTSQTAQVRKPPPQRFFSPMMRREHQARRRSRRSRTIAHPQTDHRRRALVKPAGRSSHHLVIQTRPCSQRPLFFSRCCRVASLCGGLHSPITTPMVPLPTASANGQAPHREAGFDRAGDLDADRLNCPRPGISMRHAILLQPLDIRSGTISPVAGYWLPFTANC